MKILIILGLTVLTLNLLTACGGGESTSVSVGAPTTPQTGNPQTPPSGTSTGDLIIDNGRGTSNNQDTERAKD